MHEGPRRSRLLSAVTFALQRVASFCPFARGSVYYNDLVETLRKTTPELDPQLGAGPTKPQIVLPKRGNLEDVYILKAP